MPSTSDESPGVDLQLSRLADRIAGLRHSFENAEPCPHVVIDDFLPEDVAHRVLDEIRQTQQEWAHYHHYNQKKLAITDIELMGPRTRELFGALQSTEFLQLVEQLTGIEGLLADPDLDGAGLHRIDRGGFLNIHTDFLSHPKKKTWTRQVNLLLFLNEGWQEEWKGNLEFWDASMQDCEASIAPIFNRCVFFHTTETSFHGHPDLLECPEDVSRQSIALYYFRDEHAVASARPTEYKARPQDATGKRTLMAVDQWALRAFTFLKRHTPLTDRFINRLLKFF